jgi:DNA uptake protein ComE-like DNA-binding protein
MWKKVWKYFSTPMTAAEAQMKGLLLFLFSATFLVVAPIVYHQLLPKPQVTKNTKYLDSLQLCYTKRLDSLDLLNPTDQRLRNGFQEQERYAYQEEYSFLREDYPSEKTNSSKYQYQPKQITPNVLHMFNLNQATEQDLIAINGIGETFAKRIIAYKEKLGGFYSPNQIYEVYGLDSLVVTEIKKHLTGDLNITSTLNINTDEFKILLKHPYLEYDEVKAIFKNRPIASKESLCRILPNKCAKLNPYISYRF